MGPAAPDAGALISTPARTPLHLERDVDVLRCAGHIGSTCAGWDKEEGARIAGSCTGRYGSSEHQEKNRAEGGGGERRR